MSQAKRWMLYGANGYTGELIAEAALRKGEKPILAGRRADAIRPLADRLGLEPRIFALDDDVARHLDDVDLVLLSAGPFSRTSKPMLDACLARSKHYLDITGEMSVFEACHAKHDQAAKAGCVLIPGVGFDVVPSDCLAASLAMRMPDATELTLAFAALGQISHGTATTALENLSRGGAVRKDGAIVPVPLAWKTLDVPFFDKPRRAVTIPWGDVATAFYSTHIPNIEVYLAQPPALIRLQRLLRPFLRALGHSAVQRALNFWIDKRPSGPDAAQRASGRCELWGKVRNPRGDELTATLTTPEGYELTVHTALACLQRVLGNTISPGYHTPSTAFGAAFIQSIEGCTLRVENSPRSP